MLKRIADLDKKNDEEIKECNERIESNRKILEKFREKIVKFESEHEKLKQPV